MAADLLVEEYWKDQNFELGFYLSDLVLLRVPIRVRAHACNLREILAGAAPNVPPEPGPGTRGYLVRSCPGSPVVPVLARTGNFQTYRMATYDHCYIDMEMSFSEYQAKFSAKTRSTITRKVKKFMERPGETTRFERYADPDEMRTFHRIARPLSARTYQEKLLDLGLPEDEAFVSGMVSAAAEGQVRAFLLFDGEKPVAYLYTPIRDGVVVYAYLGFDPSYAGWSPGTVLLWMSLENLYKEGRFSFLDFTEGWSSQKHLFSTGRRPCYNVLHLKRGWAATSLLRGHRVFDQGVLRLGRLFQTLGLKQRVKQLLRGG